ncbi:DUF1015 family protein [Haloactinomyces albus]|uniref:Uncharacterized protein (DUF1015 family) n=1 Tax=Haloactinomyces albus TaxID=1352928 RepID=A0AAE3ZFQ7_9ACTN|nr:DUF1015 family protein [Haloactinomyces albus]MDR7304113.1 uncharacterized protein (DUF1015 family) [Haloactinomyces albus]
MNGSQAQQTTPARELSGHPAGITVRPPEVLVIDPRRTETVDGTIDPTRVRRLLDAGGYTRPSVPAVVVYRLEAGRHRQTGVVVEVSIDDYRNRRIRCHEATSPERERRIEQLTVGGGIEQMPVTLAHPDRPRLRELLDGITVDEPDVRLNSADGITHTVWIRHDAELAETVQDEIGDIETLYIADGHHRMVAAERNARRRSRLNGEHAHAFTLAALFPSSEMRILGYHRCLPMPEGTSAADVLEVLAAHPVTARIEECDSAQAAQPAPGVVGVRVDGRCYRLWLRAPWDADQVRASLDAVALDEKLLPAVLDMAGADSGDRATPTHGGGAGGTGCWCAEREALSFFPHPPSVEQVMAVSDAGLLMPPKSTWFDPKASAGLFARELCSVSSGRTRAG